MDERRVGEAVRRIGRVLTPLRVAFAAALACLPALVAINTYASAIALCELAINCCC